MRTFELKPINGRKSFGGKCFVEEHENGDKVLKSYHTEVVRLVNGKGLRFSEDKENYSQTTMAHIRSFLSFYGLPEYSRKNIFSIIS